MTETRKSVQDESRTMGMVQESSGTRLGIFHTRNIVAPALCGTCTASAEARPEDKDSDDGDSLLFNKLPSPIVRGMAALNNQPTELQDLMVFSGTSAGDQRLRPPFLEAQETSAFSGDCWRVWSWLRAKKPAASGESLGRSLSRKMGKESDFVLRNSRLRGEGG